MEDASPQSKRLEWIDWMKSIGIYFIVLGHFYSIGEKQIYVFHVPLFFVISGFLCKKESVQQVFWKKLWYNLLVPMVIMVILNFIYACILQLMDGTFEVKIFYWFVRNILFGMVSGFDALWFVYTLILLKIIYQYCSSKIMFNILVVLMLALAYIYNHFDFSSYPFFMNAPNALINIFTAYPFFAVGIFVRDFKGIINDWNHKAMLLFSAICGLFLVCISDYYNNYVAMYRCDYGSQMFWFLVGGVMGSIMIFAVSKLLGHTSKPINIISRGTIIILGFHKMFIDLVRAFFPASCIDIVFAAIIIIIFVPVIVWVESYTPILAGKYRIRKVL